MREWTLHLPWKTPPLTLNQRMHWAVKARLTKELRLIAKVKARSIPDLGRCTVELVWYVTDKRRRDADNPVLTLKALCDGLVDAEIVPDDTPEYMRKLPVRIEYRPKRTAAGMVLVIREED